MKVGQEINVVFQPLPKEYDELPPPYKAQLLVVRVTRDALVVAGETASINGLGTIKTTAASKTTGDYAYAFHRFPDDTWTRERRVISLSTVEHDDDNIKTDHFL